MPAFSELARAQAQVDIGHSEAAWARFGKDAMGIPISNAAALDYGRAAAKNLVEGTIRLNKEKQRKHSEEVKALTRRVLKAAKGKPLKRSISTEMQQQRQAADLIQSLLQLALVGDNKGKSAPASGMQSQSQATK